MPGKPHLETGSIRVRLQSGWRLIVPEKRVLTFKELFDQETRQLETARAGGIDPADQAESRVDYGVAGEPYVGFTPYDRFGLALSGGGIRSATFNLGLLQSLGRLGILGHVDYLSTVSGGGYIGAFWTAWLCRRGSRTGSARFPVGNDGRGGERSEVRHLREFSRFLLPRVRIIETEFWGIVMTIIGGVLPSFLAAMAVLMIGWYLWIAGLIALSLPGGWGPGVPAILLLVYFALSELGWQKAGRAERSFLDAFAYAVTGLAATALFFFGLKSGVLTRTNSIAAGWASYSPSWSSCTAATAVLTVPAALAGCTVALLVLRLIAARLGHAADWVSGRIPAGPGAEAATGKRISVPALVGMERCVTRLLGLTVGFAAVAALWLLAGWLSSSGHSLYIKFTAGGTTILTGFFVWAKKWLTEPEEETRGSKSADAIWGWLKRATPKVLAGLVWLLLFLIVGSSVHWWGDGPDGSLEGTFWLPLAVAAGIIALTLLLFDSSRVGLHDFYRSRIARCYLGASNQSILGHEDKRAALNRYVAERPGDDLTLGELRNLDRPLHLVCVAANDISGDPLGNLYRGARSAVLSGHGISLGDETARLDGLRFSTAITASAAAFNSQMGRISMDLGPAVSFLMSALNLRLGLWVPHPSNRYRRGTYLFPGRFFLMELFGLSHTDGANLHLSDGDHFENFGLYELVRRHCRYIIVSDCGADPDVAFDDLANVVRRVREDFGVEIELDVESLRPDAEGRAKQHAVVGTIHYNGPAGMDKGTLLYFKPAITGGEPSDVLQYRTRNVRFPHESTVQQFYDAAQWESYRRLGEAAGEAVLGFFETPTEDDVDVPDRLFRDVRSRLAPSTGATAGDGAEMGDRCATLEHDLMTDGPEHLRAEFFPEAMALAALASKPAAESDANLARQAADAAVSKDLGTLAYLLRVVQIMEDVWVAADAGRGGASAMDEGWINYFRRWAATPSFRRWWPVLAPLYELGLREFVERHFAVGAVDPQSLPGGALLTPKAQLQLRVVGEAEVPSFLAESFAGRQYLQTRPRPDPSGRRLFAYDLELLDYSGKLSGVRFPVGFALVREEPIDAANPDGRWAVGWNADELFVPDSLYGAGFYSKTLDSLLRFYRMQAGAAERTMAEARVRFRSATDVVHGGPAQPRKTTGAAALERVRDIGFYKSRGFKQVSPENATTHALTLSMEFRRALPPSSPKPEAGSAAPAAAP
jgi:hypothetical protein